MSKKILIITIFWFLPRGGHCLPSSERNMEMGMGIMDQLKASKKLPAGQRQAERKRLIYSLGGVSKVQAQIFMAEAGAERRVLQSLIEGDTHCLYEVGLDRAGKYFKKEYASLIEFYRQTIALFEFKAAELQRISNVYRNWARPGVFDLPDAGPKSSAPENPAGQGVEFNPGAPANRQGNGQKNKNQESLKVLGFTTMLMALGLWTTFKG